MANLINNLTIKAKLLAGFGTIIAVLAIVSTLSYTHFVTVGHEVEEMELAAEELALAANLEVQFLKMTRAARQFVQKGDDASEAQTKEFAAKTHKAITAAKAGMKIAKHAAQVEEIQKAFVSYEAGFFEVTKLQHEHDSLIENSLNPTADKMIVDLDALVADARAENNKELTLEALEAREHAFLIQVYTGRFLLEGKQSYGDKVAKEFVAFEKTLKKMSPILHTDHEKKLHQELLELRAKYQTVYANIQLDEEKIYKLMDVQMPKFAGVILKNSEALEHEAAEHEHEVAKEAQHEIKTAEFEILLLMFIGVSAGVGIAVLLTAVISKPIRSITSIMRELADNHLDADVSYQDRKDEIGNMAEAVQVFKDNAIERVRLEADAAEQAKQEIERVARVDELIAEYENTATTVMDAVVDGSHNILEIANSMGGSINKTSSGSLEVAEASLSTSHDVESAAAATAELSASIQEISRQVTQSSPVANSAVREAEEVNTKIQGLNNAAQKIGDVVSMITDIAEQTNLLALNATIEAARAGDAGKGFAVVASEVKNLANQTSKATDEISEQIGKVQAETRESMDAIQNVTNTITNIDEIVTSISAAVEEQSAATSEIAQTVERVDQSAKLVADRIASVTRNSANSYGSAIKVIWAADSLDSPIKKMNSETSGFLSSVRI